MDTGMSDELLLEVDHVKYRKAGEGRSPIGRIFVYKNLEGYKRKMLYFLNEYSDEDMLQISDDWIELDGMSNGYINRKHEKTEEENGEVELDLTQKEMTEVRSIHEAVSMLLKHFWLSFPAVTPELEAKVERIYDSLVKYRDEQLAEASRRYGIRYVEHCYAQIERVNEKFCQFSSKRKK